MLNPDTITISYELLLVGFSIWIVNIGIYALAYWEFDTGGPEIRELGLPTVFKKKTYPDFVFVQQKADPNIQTPPNWRPGFIDYLYLSITTSTAFGPSEPTPYTHSAKIMTGSQSLVSLFTLGLIIARAISL